MATDPASDPLVRALRTEISANDREIVEAVNRRLELVARLREHKRERGYEFLDKGREEALFAELEQANGGPLSDEGVRELVAHLLDLTKRELA
jgi:chorismate mutase